MSVGMMAERTGERDLGMGKDVPDIETKNNGARQTAIPYRFDLIDPIAMFELAKVVSEGAKKYAPDNWRGLTVEDNLNRVLAHVYAHLAGDETDDHLEHALTRMVFAVAKKHRPDYRGRNA